MRSTPAAMPGVFKYRKMQDLAKKQGLTNRALAAAVDGMLVRTQADESGQ